MGVGQCPAAHRQTFTNEPFRLVVVRLLRAQQSQLGEAFSHIRMVAAVQRATSIERVAEELVCPLVVPETLVQRPERVEQLGLDGGLAAEALRLLKTAIDERHHAKIVRRGRIRLACIEEIQHELLHALRPRGLLGRDGACSGQSNGVGAGHRCQYDDRRARNQERTCVAPREFVRSIPNRVRPCIERLSIQEVIHVADKGLDARVPAFRIGVHRRQAQRVEIGPRRSALACTVS